MRNPASVQLDWLLLLCCGNANEWLMLISLFCFFSSLSSSFALSIRCLITKTNKYAFYFCFIRLHITHDSRLNTTFNRTVKYHVALPTIAVIIPNVYILPVTGLNQCRRSRWNYRIVPRHSPVVTWQSRRLSTEATSTVIICGANLLSSNQTVVLVVETSDRRRKLGRQAGIHVLILSVV